MNAEQRRGQPPRFRLMLGALVVLIAIAVPATRLARLNAAVPRDRQSDPPTATATPTRIGQDASLPSATATPTVLGISGIASRGVRAAPFAAQATVCPAATPLQGIDVSQYQGSVNWTQVAQSGKAFAYARAADGATYLDPNFQSNYAGIKQAGMKAGAYLFFRPAQDPVAQANTLVTALQQAHFAPGDLVPVFDVEVSDGQSGATIAANLQTAITNVQKGLGVTPAIYTAPLTWNSIVGATTFGPEPLWIANWFVTCPSLPNGWSTWVVWQYSDISTVPGISGNVDADESNGPTLPITSPSPTPMPPRGFLPVVHD